MDQTILREVGHRLYQTERLKEMKRYLVFRARCRMHKKDINGLLDFFAETPERQAILHGTPAFVEQATRAFFYKGSDYADRIALIKNHVLFMEQHFTAAAVSALYVDVDTAVNEGKQLTLWQDMFEDEPLSMKLCFKSGQRKEGCLSLILSWADQSLYQIMFWFGPDPAKDGTAIWIGALQGMPNGGDVIKQLTKAFFGYRTKNLIFYGLRNLARCLGITQIYAVTNEGYYAMNHIRKDRKLKTDFGAFWAECGGTLRAEDPRFFAIPVAEYRKDMSELKPSKRAQHRRRFEKLDEINVAFAESCKKYLLQGH